MEKLKKNDILLIVIILIVSVIGYFIIRTIPSQEGNQVKITVNGKIYGIVSLNKDDIIKIEDEKGNNNTIEIKDNYVKMTSASCHDKYCIHQGKISKGNQTIVCLPNKVIIEIINEGNIINEIDTIAG